MILEMKVKNDEKKAYFYLKVNFHSKSTNIVTIGQNMEAKSSVPV